MHELSAFILAGGKSSRMGSDKAFLELAGRTLLVRALDLAKSISGHVSIVGDPQKFSAFGEVIADVYPGHGPLGGIHAALATSSTELNFMLGVDLPFLEAHLLRYLVSQAQASGAVVTVPFAAGHYQTLCAVYRRSFAVIAEEALKEGKNKIDALFSKVSLRTVSEEELTPAGFTAAAFRNVNTPEEWENTRRELVSERQHL